MKVLRIAATAALLALPAYARAQMPNINLVPETVSKTPEEKEQDEIRDKAYRESLRKIPDAKTSTDPWGNVRSDTPKAAAPAAKHSASAKPKTKTGSSAN
jgi:hypothetical protein